MSYGSDWTCECGWANLDVRKRCRNCRREKCEPDWKARAEAAEAEIARLRNAIAEKDKALEPIAYMVHNMMLARTPTHARGKFSEPDHFLYPASRADDARETAKIMRGDLTPLYAKDPT